MPENKQPDENRESDNTNIDIDIDSELFGSAVVTNTDKARSEMSVSDPRSVWSSFLKLHYLSQLSKISREYPNTRSLEIDYNLLERFGIGGIKIADEILANPEGAIKGCRDALRFGVPEQNAPLIHRPVINKKSDVNEVIDDLHIRFIHLPKKTVIREIRANDIGRMISLDGIVRRATEVRPRLVAGMFKCSAGHDTKHIIEDGIYSEPMRCSFDGCKLKPTYLVKHASTFTDSQKLRIQEVPEGLRGGEQPQTIDVDVVDDLCGCASPGDKVVINGILRSVQRVISGKKTAVFELYVECNSIEISVKEFDEVNITIEDEERIKELAARPDIYEQIPRSIAPSIYGLEEVKSAVALQLFGGLSKQMPDGSTLRGDIHILLVGDPGIAKSQLLRYVAKIAPRGIYTSGKSASAAGLTAAVVKDDLSDNRWTLEAGALVIADKGIAVVDEMDKMAEYDRSALHEAMEQQTVSIAKAGITASLHTRCSLLGAANPKLGRFDEYGDIAEQINMAPSLLSRFDLIFIMKDKCDSELDYSVAQHIIGAHTAGERLLNFKRKPNNIRYEDEETQIKEQLKPVTADIDAVLLRKYIAYSKRNCFPAMTDEAQQMLIEYYHQVRSAAYGNQDKPVPVTARQLEALVRLAEASARVRLSDKVDETDAARVIRVVDTCLKQVAYDPQTGALDIDKVVGGASASQRKITRDAKNTIKTLKDAATQTNFTQSMSDLGYTPKESDEILNKLLKDGDCFINPKNIIKLKQRARN